MAEEPGTVVPKLPREIRLRMKGVVGRLGALSAKPDVLGGTTSALAARTGGLVAWTGGHTMILFGPGKHIHDIDGRVGHAEKRPGGGQ